MAIDGAKYLLDLLDRRFDIDRTTGTHTGLPESYDPNDVQKREQELAERRAEIARLRAAFANDPQGVLDRFRAFFHDSALTIDDLQEYLDAWEFAITQPDAFANAVDTGQPSFGIGDWFN